MTNVANTSRQHLVVPVKGGKPISLAPGEGRSVEIDKDHPSIKAKVGAGLIAIGGTKAQAEKAARGGTARIGSADPTPPVVKEG